MMTFLPTWARRLSWREPARVFRTRLRGRLPLARRVCRVGFGESRSGRCPDHRHRRDPLGQGPSRRQLPHRHLPDRRRGSAPALGGAGADQSHPTPRTSGPRPAGCRWIALCLQRHVEALSHGHRRKGQPGAPCCPPLPYRDEPHNKAADQVRREESGPLRGRPLAKRVKKKRWKLLRCSSRVHGRAWAKLDSLLASRLAPPEHGIRRSLSSSSGGTARFRTPGASWTTGASAPCAAGSSP